MTLREQLYLVMRLSVPSILAQLSVIAMQYIDTAMVGHLGTNGAAAIGLVETTIWLFGGICSAFATGFYVQVAHRIGAGDATGARAVLRGSLTATLCAALFLLSLGVILSGPLPVLLGGEEAIRSDASTYFLIFSIGLPFCLFEILAGGMLRCSGNMVVPSMINILLCVMDVILNFFLIFPTRDASIWGLTLTIPGAGLAVKGAALGTLTAYILASLLMLYFLCFRSRELGLRKERGSFLPSRESLRRALKIGVPLGVQQTLMSGAHIVTTLIIAPLGAVALAAHSFGIAIESLCYMPGQGIADAATTLVGQSAGSGNKRLMRQFACICVAVGIGVMTIMGIIMWCGAPLALEAMTPVAEIQELGTTILRIEAFAEPMFAAAIVCYAAFIAAGDTFMPSGINLTSIWFIRLSLAAMLAPTLGLKGVWVAMCLELCVRGCVFLLRLRSGKWMEKKL